MRWPIIFSGLIALLLGSCHRQVTRWELIGEERQREWRDDQPLASLRKALDYQLGYLKGRLAKNPDATLGLGNTNVRLDDLINHLTELANFITTDPSQTELSQWLSERFEAQRYFSDERAGKILVTSYYVGDYAASLKADERFRYPIYPLPGPRPGATNQQVYEKYTRAQIDYEGALDGKIQPLAWLDNDLERYLLQVQGSGILRLTDGSRLLVGYAGNNGYPYVALGSLLIADKKFDRTNMNLRGLSKYFHDYPDEFERFARKMPRTIFFQIKPFAETTIGVPVTDLRTIAVDPSQIPHGALAFLQTRRPSIDAQGNLQNFQPLSLYVLAQDTGSAIQGAHIDLFWGTGNSARLHAGYMKEEGELYLLIPKVDGNIKSVNE